MFAHDRDLLALDPTLFRDNGWAGQRLVRGTATISFVTLAFDTQDVALDDAGVDAGHVVVVGGTPYEITQRISGAGALVSRLRPRVTDPPIVPTPAEGADAFITTFLPQIGIAHRQVLRLAGLDPGPSPAPGQVGEIAVLNGDDLVPVVAAGALFIIYTAAAAAAGPDSPAAERARTFRDLFALERQRAVVRLDLDGDGLSDATRCLAATQIARA